MRYLVAILAIIFFVILAAVLLIDGGNGNGGQADRLTKIADYDTNDGASVSWTQQGKLVGDDQYRAIRITITRTSRRAEVLAGYQERVDRSVDLPNTPAAFEAFTRGLDNAGFGKERDVKQPDERGVCPLGHRYIYRLTENGREVMRTWSDTCQASNGPYGGGSNGASTIQHLFKAQITDYPKFVNGVVL